MANWPAVLSGVSFALQMKDRQDRKEAQTQRGPSEQGGYEYGNEVPPDVKTAKDTARTARQVERLVRIEEKNRPSPGDKDAFSSATVELNDGETVEVTVTPVDGFNLRVKRVEFDRRNDHDYELNVGGDVTSVSHRAVYQSPKLVSQSDRVLATATNNSGSTTTIDFELEAWAERSDR